MPSSCIVVGCGVVGGILAAHLAAARNEVCVVDAAKDIADAVGKDGLDIRGVLTCRARVAKAFRSIPEAGAIEPDYVFVCVKTTALPELAPQLEVWAGGRALVVSAQNGIDTEELLAGHFPRERVLRVVVNFAGGVLKPGCVQAAFFHPPNFVGPVAPLSAPAAEGLASLLTSAGLQSAPVASIKKEAWRKTILNSCLMPVAVLTGLTMKHLMELEATRAIAERQIRDFLAVAGAEGHVFEDGFMDRALHYLSNAGNHKPSMLVDFEAGLPLELDFLNGKIQQYSDKHGVPCETNRLILSLVAGILRHRELKRSSSA